MIFKNMYVEKRVFHKCTKKIFIHLFVCLNLSVKKMIVNNKKSNNSHAYPTPLNRTGLLVGLPTIVGAFNKFSGSATIRVCWRQKETIFKIKT